MEFEWDEAKARANERKHGISFEIAMRVFDDPNALSEQDRVEGDELRWQTLGLVHGVLLVLVAHTVRQDAGEDEIIRIISVARYRPGRSERLPRLPAVLIVKSIIPIFRRLRRSFGRMPCETRSTDRSSGSSPCDWTLTSLPGSACRARVIRRGSTSSCAR